MTGDIIDYISRENVDMEHRFCVEVLKLKSLHFGYWDRGEALTFENLRKAQKRYGDELISHIPDDVKTILDVGCGIGDNARALAERGYLVVAISPDRNHERYFNNPGGGNIAYYKEKFEDLDLDETFDLVLMSESQNYFDADIGFRQCQRYVKPRGYLLVCGLFKRTNNDRFTYIRNTEEDYIGRAANHGFILKEALDITEEITPTLAYARKMHGEYVVPALDIVRFYAKGSSSLKLSVVKMLLRKELRRMLTIYKYYEEFFHPDRFRENVRYVTQLYEHRVRSPGGH